MATINTRNFGTATGRLTKDPVAFTNDNGSKKVVVNLALRDNFKGKDGKTGSQFVDFTAFVSADANGDVYSMMHEGDLVSITYELRNDNYTGKDGQKHFNVQLRITGVDLLEPKSVTEARLKARAEK